MKTHPLSERVASLRQRIRVIHATSGLCWGIFAAAGVVVIACWVDVAFDLPPAARVAAWLLALVAALLPLIAGLRAAISRATTEAVSHALDAVAKTRGEIHAAVDLLLRPTSAMAHGGISEGFGNLAIQKAASLAASIPGSYVVPAEPVGRAIIALVGAALALGLFSLVAPRLAGAELLRFTDPYGDHPPYTLLSFSVAPGNTKVVYGANLPISVSVKGGSPDRVDLIVYSQDLKTNDSLPMFPDPAKGWQATITGVVSPGWYAVKSGNARTERFKLDVITVPRIQSERVRITPPAYTHLPPYEGPVPPAGIAGLPGTRVDLFVISNRPLSGGTIRFAGKENPPPTVMKPVGTKDAGNEVLGTFTLTTAGRLSVDVTDIGGQVSTEPFSANLVLTADQKPFVRILQPLAQSFATPNVDLPVELSAEDDYGISRLQLYRGINDSQLLPQDLPIPTPAPTRLPSQTKLPLSAYGLKPGDTIKLFAHVEDTNPAGPGMSDSSVVIVTIISEATMQQMVLARQSMETLQSKYDQANRRLGELNDQIDALMKDLPASDAALTDAQHKQLDALAAEAKKQAAAVREAEKDDLPFDLDKALRKNLEIVAASIDDLEKGARSLAQRPGMSTAGARNELKNLQQKLQGERKDYQQEATDPLERLASIFPLQEDQARFEQAYERQRDLATRLHALRDKNGEDNPDLKNRMRDMEEEQRTLRQDMQKLLDDIDSHTAELPEDPQLDDLRKTAQAFSKAARESTIVEEMASSESGLAQFSGLLGHAGATRAADLMEELMSKCQSIGNQAQTCLKFQPKLASALGNTVQQMLDAEGLSSRPGNGQGGSGGYSMQRNSLQNVGLYGRLPEHAQAGQSGGKHADHGVGADGWGRNQPGATDIVNNHSRQRAAGGSDASVPPQYRKQVGDYFQRVADDLGGPQ